MQFNLEEEFQRAEQTLVITNARKHIAAKRALQAETGEKKSALVVSGNKTSLSTTIKKSVGKNSKVNISEIKKLIDPNNQKHEVRFNIE